jgi:chemotaxis protein methyltransferase CheR
MIPDLERIEIDLLLEGVYRRYGYDLRHYLEPVLGRSLRNLMVGERVKTITALTEKLLHDEAVMERLLLALSLHPAPLFNDPGFYARLRTDVVPRLPERPRIWIAGCATGEDVYSLAILLEETGRYPDARIYATDLSEAVLAKAARGSVPRDMYQGSQENYREAGGTRSLEDYTRIGGDVVFVDPLLRRNVFFAHHNLATDGSFNEFHLVLCRHAMETVDEQLRTRVRALVHDSLSVGGVFALGGSSTPRPPQGSYEELSDGLYRRVA